MYLSSIGSCWEVECDDRFSLAVLGLEELDYFLEGRFLLLLIQVFSCETVPDGTLQKPPVLRAFDLFDHYDSEEFLHRGCIV